MSNAAAKTKHEMSKTEFWTCRLRCRKDVSYCKFMYTGTYVQDGGLLNNHWSWSSHCRIESIVYSSFMVPITLVKTLLLGTHRFLLAQPFKHTPWAGRSSVRLLGSVPLRMARRDMTTIPGPHKVSLNSVTGEPTGWCEYCGPNPTWGSPCTANNIPLPATAPGNSYLRCNFVLVYSIVIKILKLLFDLFTFPYLIPVR